MSSVASASHGPVLVTGGAGHLGANLVRRLLNDGHRVRVLLRPEDDNSAMDALVERPARGAPAEHRVERVFGDLRDPDEVRDAVAGCARVFHAGAKVSTIEGDHAHQREIFDCNVLGTRHVLQAAKDEGVSRVVVTGSFSAVGFDPDDPSKPADETVQFYPFHRTMPYERSKVLVEHECLKAVADGLDVVIATSCAIIGGHDYLPSRMGRTIADYANGKLRAWVPGGFEFVAARDIVEGHVLAMERGRTGHKYIISTEYLEIDELMSIFEEVTGVPKPRLRLPGPVMLAFSEAASFYLSRFHPSFPQRLTPGAIRLLGMRRRADHSKAVRELGFRPTSMRDAVREAYAFHYGRGAVTNPQAKPPDWSPRESDREVARPQPNDAPRPAAE